MMTRGGGWCGSSAGKAVGGDPEVVFRVVQEVLGHTRVTTTERYTHMTTLQMRDASERMGEALSGE